MKIAYILPSLSYKAPILVVRDIVDQLHDKVEAIDVYYFDDIIEVEFKCPVHRIKFAEKFDFEKYDIIHSHMYRPDKYIWKNRKYLKGKTITTIHLNIATDLQYSYNLFVSLIFRWIWLIYLSSATKIVALTKSAINEQYAKYFSAKKLRYVYNGRTPQSDGVVCENDKKMFIDLKASGYKIIGSNAILSKRKALHTIIEAMPLLPDYALILIGDGEYKENLIHLAQKKGVANRCHFLGFKKNATAYLRYYDVYAMPSYSEGFGLALVEACLQRRSCICSDLSSFHEMFTDNEVTFFTSWDADSIKHAIEDAYNSRKIKGEMAYLRSMNNYTAEVMGANYLSVYESMLIENK